VEALRQPHKNRLGQHCPNFDMRAIYDTRLS